MASFDLILKTRGSLHPDGEPTQFVSEYSGVRTCTDDETGDVSKVGRVTALRVHAGLAHNPGESLFDVCDAHSQELHVLHTMLYEPEGYNFQDGIQARFDTFETDLLVLDCIVLAPQVAKTAIGAPRGPAVDRHGRWRLWSGGQLDCPTEARGGRLHPSP